MNTKTATKLINPTFVEDLHTQQELAKKEFAELKKQERLQRKKDKEEYMVFNYLWRCFPEIMTIKNQNPKLLRKEIVDSEFERILKVAKRFYGFRAYSSIALMVGSFIVAFLSSSYEEFEFLTMISFSIMLFSVFPLVLTCSSYFSPKDSARDEENRRRYLRSLYQNTQSKKNSPEQVNDY